MLYTKVLAPARRGCRRKPSLRAKCASDRIQYESPRRGREHATERRAAAALAAGSHPQPPRIRRARALPPLAHHPFALALLGALAAAPARLLPPLAGAAVFFLGAFVSC